MPSTKRKRLRARSATVEVAAAPAGSPSSLWSGYAAAADTPDRARLWWPTVDTRQEIDSFSRAEIMRRVRWLFANEGFIRGFIYNLAALVGYQTPQFDSGDEEWDELAEQAFRDSCLTPEVFDLAGKYDFESVQEALKICRYRDGDILTVLTETENGRARIALYESHQLRNPSNPPASQTWRDGVLLGPGGRHLAYGLWDPGTDTVTVVSARDCIYSGTWDTPGHVRAVPPLAHAVNHAVDITEVISHLKKAIKVSSLFGAVREYEGSSQPRSRMGITGPGATLETTTTGQNVETAKVFGAGQIPRLDPGEKLKTFQDDRPHPNILAFIDTCIRDMAVGFKVFPEVVWEMAKLTGPGVRFLLDLTDRRIKQEQRADRRWARRFVTYWVAKEIKSGRLPMPRPRQPGQKPRWWAFGFQSQRNLTIDRSKESRSRIDEIDAGVGTWSGWDDLDGMHWKDRTRQRIREIKFALAECAAADIPFDLLLRPRQGAAPSAPSSDPPPPEEIEDRRS